jgi:transposase
VHDLHLVGANLLELDSLPVRRPSPRRVKQGLCMDKGYDYPIVRDRVASFGFVGHIRSRGEEVRALRRSRGERPRRWVVERAHSWYNRFRGLLIRWCKKDDNYLAQLHLASAIIIGNFVGLFG